MITYGSYMSRKESVVRASILVVLLDTVIAIVATVIMFSVIFSSPGMDEQIGRSTAGMLFITLPTLFYEVVPFGTVLAPLFYLLVGFAALTSTISLLEVIVSYFIDQRGFSRTKATAICGTSVFALSVLCGLSLGGWGLVSDFSWVYAGTDHAKRGLFDHLDYLASNLLLPIGGFLITLGVGWFMTRDKTHAELVDANTPGWFNYDVWRFFMRFIAPAAVFAIIVAVMFGMDFS